MNQAVTFSLDMGIQDLMVDCSNFRLIVPLKLNESYSSEAKKDIKVHTVGCFKQNFSVFVQF